MRPTRDDRSREAPREGDEVDGSAPDRNPPRELEARFLQIQDRHGARDTGPARDERLRFARHRFQEGQRLHAHLAARFPEVVRPGATVLDVGCGNAGFALPFAAAGLPTLLLDVHPHEEVRAILAGAGVAARHLVAGGDALPLHAGSVDLVLLAETLEHVARPRRLGAEVARVLRPGGLAFVTTPPRLRFLLGRDPHYGIRGLLLLPDPVQRLVFERVLRRGRRYDVAHTFWTAAGVLATLPGLSAVEIVSRNWAGPLRRLDWDWIVARRPRDQSSSRGS